MEKPSATGPVNTTNYTYILVLITLGLAILTFVTYTRAKTEAKDGEGSSLFK
jgi:hypothetical protein